MVYCSITFGQEIEIKSLKAYTDKRSCLPALFHNRKLNIEFDIQSPVKPNLAILFRFCNKNWQPYNNIFLRDVGSDVERNLIFDRLPSPVIQAQYHYAGYFPNLNKYNSVDINPQFDGIEYSRFFQFSDNDLNGGDILLNYNNDNATYLNITFLFKPPSSDCGKIFIVGSFNNWKVSPDYQMHRNGELYSFTKSLKRGIYDYQYVTGDINDGHVSNIDWYVFEGNFYETSNDYYIFLNYNDSNYGGYDRVVGFYKFKS
jgi:hypothetical protein